MSSIPLYSCMCLCIYIHKHIHTYIHITSLSIHLVSGHLGYFHVLAIVNSAAMECMYLFQLEFSSFLNICPGEGLLAHMVTVSLFFKGTSMLFSTVIALVYNSVGRFSFLHTLSSVYCLWTFWWWPFWLVLGDTSLQFWFAFLC